MGLWVLFCLSALPYSVSHSLKVDPGPGRPYRPSLRTKPHGKTQDADEYQGSPLCYFPQETNNIPTLVTFHNDVWALAFQSSKNLHMQASICRWYLRIVYFLQSGGESPGSGENVSLFLDSVEWIEEQRSGLVWSRWISEFWLEPMSFVGRAVGTQWADASRKG